MLFRTPLFSIETDVDTAFGKVTRLYENFSGASFDIDATGAILAVTGGAALGILGTIYFTRPQMIQNFVNAIFKSLGIGKIKLSKMKLPKMPKLF